MEKKKIRILFLDIDGILNSETYYRKRAENNDARPYPLSEFDPEAVQQCMRIIEETGAKTVVSSSWRHTDGLRSIFKNVGFRGNILDFDITPYLGGIRGLEIKKYMTDYLDKHPDEEIESYCILDDDTDMLYEQKDNFVRTDAFYGGLTKEKADEVIKILNKNKKVDIYAIYQKYKGKEIHCLVNDEDNNLIDGIGIVCGYKDNWLIVGFNDERKGCIKTFTNSVYLDNQNFSSYRFWNIKYLKKLITNE